MLKNTFKNPNNFVALALFVGLFNYYLFFYGITNRQHIYDLFLQFAFLFGGYGYVLMCLKYYGYKKYILLFYTSIAFRLLPILSIPLLSDDFYRFIWDGLLLQNHLNPFAYTPQQIVKGNAQTNILYLFKHLNSPNYYSVYPPVNQFIFWLSGFAPKANLLYSVIILRLCLIAFDFGNLLLIKKLLAIKKLNPNLVFIYALNPLVIIEFAGNLHFEVVMLFFTLLGIYLLYNQKNNWSALSLGFAVCTKLLPLIFIPLLVKQIGWLKTIKYGLIVAATTLFLFLPIIHNTQLLSNFLSSLKLYYGTFEFNGSFYQVFKHLGWAYFGYNPIAYTSKILLLLTSIGFVFTYLKSKSIFEGIFLLLFIYVIFGATVHPWYVLPLVAFTPFIKWRFGVIWSGLVFLSYYTYRIFPYQESIFMVGLEYALLLMFIIYEFYAHRKTVS